MDSSLADRRCQTPAVECGDGLSDASHGMLRSRPVDARTLTPIAITLASTTPLTTRRTPRALVHSRGAITKKECRGVFASPRTMKRPVATPIVHQNTLTRTPVPSVCAPPVPPQGPSPSLASGVRTPDCRSYRSSLTASQPSQTSPAISHSRSLRTRSTSSSYRHDASRARERAFRAHA